MSFNFTTQVHQIKKEKDMKKLNSKKFKFKNQITKTKNQRKAIPTKLEEIGKENFKEGNQKQKRKKKLSKNQIKKNQSYLQI